MSEREPIALGPRCRLVAPRERSHLGRALRVFVTELAREVAAGASPLSVARRLAPQHPDVAPMFELSESSGAAGFGLKEEELFPASNERLTGVQLVDVQAGSRWHLDLTTPEEWGAFADLLALASAGVWTAEDIRPRLESEWREVFDELLADGFFRPAATPPAAGPGVYRLQHACVLLRSTCASVLVDPVFHSANEPMDLRRSCLRCEAGAAPDAIILSHSHSDHYDLASLLMFPRTTPIVVPAVPRISVLCEDMAARLRSLGFTRVIAPEWFGDPVTVGDMQIVALPFYGEQPLLSERPRAEGLRNWGNTYLVRTSEYTAWILIDSGADHLGRMIDVASTVRARWGRVDVVLSTLGEFAPFKPTYISGDGKYWLCLSEEQMRRFSSMRHDCLTLGPAGVAEICGEVQAGAFLPYAQWWGERAGLGAQEAPLIERLAGHLSRRAAGTQIAPWRIGDAWLPRGADAARIAPF